MPAQVVLGASAVGAAGVVLWSTVAGDRRSSRRAARNLRAGIDAVPSALDAPASQRVVLPLLARLASHARRLTPAGAVENLNTRIMRAGMSSRWPVDRTLAAKALLGAFGLVLGVLFLASGAPLLVFYGLTLPPLLFFGPDLVLRAKGRERQRRIRVALPDTLDQITVCVEAGLGFEAAMARAARTGSGPLSDELVRTLQDVQLGVARKDALHGLSDRNDVAELRQFVLAVIQAEGYGVPIGRVLRVQASELRDKRRKEAEERAMKVSIKMLFPLVVCILPTVFIVMLAPAIFQLMDALGGGLPG